MTYEMNKTIRDIINLLITTRLPGNFNLIMSGVQKMVKHKLEIFLPDF